jgi:hypothetical protein
VVSIKIDDVLFAHGDYSTAIQKSKYIVWDRSFISGKENIAIYTDNSLNRVNSRVKTKIAWLLESPRVSAYWHEWIVSKHELFDIVFTNNKDLLDLNSNFKFLPTGGCWIEPLDQLVYPKSKMISMIASSKNFTDGHAMRHSIIKRFKNIDLYGRGFNVIDKKLTGLKDYRFSVVVENTKKDYYFTEKLIDCFATGTIPIYWGCPSIDKFFDDRGILSFNTLEELEEILNNLNKELYENKLPYISNNFETAKEYIIAEDYMWEKYLEKL